MDTIIAYVALFVSRLSFVVMYVKIPRRHIEPMRQSSSFFSINKREQQKGDCLLPNNYVAVTKFNK
jgi:hypothetical protein